MKPCAGNRATRPSQMWAPSSSSNQRRPPAPVQVIIIIMVVLLTVEDGTWWCLGTPSHSRTMTREPMRKTGGGPGQLAGEVLGCVAEARTSAKRSAMHPRPRSRIQQQHRANPNYHFKEHIPGSSFVSAFLRYQCCNRVSLFIIFVSSCVFAYHSLLYELTAKGEILSIL